MSTVNHPKHYNKHPSGVECITIVEGFNFNIGNAIKYLWRAGLKSPNVVEDLEKAVWYCQREIQRFQSEVQTKHDDALSVCRPTSSQDTPIPPSDGVGG